MNAAEGRVSVPSEVQESCVNHDSRQQTFGVNHVVIPSFSQNPTRNVGIGM
jgi:hypothetical protein